MAGLFAAVAAVGQPFGQLPFVVEGPEAQSGSDAPAMQGPDASDVTVEVLDSTGNSSRADEVAATVASLGYEVVDVRRVEPRSATTKVFYTEGFEDAARELAERDERFGEAEPNPGFLEIVDLYVLVGDDWS